MPFTELVERVSELARVEENAREKVRGVVLDAYLRELPAKYDWTFLYVSSSLVTTPQYTTGTCSVNTGQTTVTFSSDVTLTADFTSRQLKITGNDVVYEATFLNTTAVTIVPSFEGPSNATNAGYAFFQPRYSLAADFDRFPQDGGVYRWAGGKKTRLPEWSYQEATDTYNPSPGTPAKVRLIDLDTAGNQRVELSPPPRDTRVYHYDYLKRLRPLTETTAGLLRAISANATQVDGLSTTRFLEATTGDWLRVDALGRGQDSQWYRIIRIDNNQSLVLQNAFANTAVTSAAYTIARAPELPARMHVGVLYGALKALTKDQNDPASLVYNAQYAEVLSDGKRLYVNRRYSPEFHTIAEEWQYRR